MTGSVLVRQHGPKRHYTWGEFDLVDRTIYHSLSWQSEARIQGDISGHRKLDPVTSSFG